MLLPNRIPDFWKSAGSGCFNLAVRRVLLSRVILNWSWTSISHLASALNERLISLIMTPYNSHYICAEKYDTVALSNLT